MGMTWGVILGMYDVTGYSKWHINYNLETVCLEEKVSGLSQGQFETNSSVDILF